MSSCGQCKAQCNVTSHCGMSHTELQIQVSHTHTSTQTQPPPVSHMGHRVHSLSTALAARLLRCCIIDQQLFLTSRIYQSGKVKKPTAAYSTQIRYCKMTKNVFLGHLLLNYQNKIQRKTGRKLPFLVKSCFVSIFHYH